MPKRIWIPALCAGVFASVVLVWMQVFSPEYVLADGLRLLRAPLPDPLARYGLTADSVRVIQSEISPNESLSAILTRYHVSASVIHRLNELPEGLFDPRSIRSARPYTVLCNPRDEAQALIYHASDREFVVLNFEDSLSVQRGAHPVDTVEHAISGSIQSSLYAAVIEAGGTPALVAELAEIYAWEIDFFGLQPGDCFKLMYSTYLVDGKPVGSGRVRAASLSHGGKEHYAVCYDQGKGPEYFDEQGNSLRQAFLKAPLKYSRISSHFSHSRLHPVLKIRRPHHGVDYAAPAGTPVHAVGDGTVTKARYSGGAGNMVEIRHNDTYTTAYLHLSRYGQGIKPGTRVQQGDVIGYVGSTGVSTGPHLDFRFYKHGVAFDPLKVEAISSGPVAPAHLQAYLAYSAPLLERLHRIDQEIPETWITAAGNEESAQRQ
ncbi:MAG: peptidoglycan DD-metalloendopeptidase family protein [Bacteroidia bacterium]|nr:peptidoglycan DD-metalloendopeptidase family protein [Bacteroidia bacterium]